ncbi:ankyrin [Neofusicoccum parvum]|nr:ankyrin [Neofusicoccum parvum]
MRSFDVRAVENQDVFRFDVSMDKIVSVKLTDANGYVQRHFPKLASVAESDASEVRVERAIFRVVHNKVLRATFGLQVLDCNVVWLFARLFVELSVYLKAGSISKTIVEGQEARTDEWELASRRGQYVSDIDLMLISTAFVESD